jgi:hypothetical protein
MTVEEYSRRTAEREKLPPIPGFDRHVSLASQMTKSDLLLMCLVMDCEAYSIMVHGHADFVATHLIEARAYLESKGIVPESGYYGGAYYLDNQPALNGREGADVWPSD